MKLRILETYNASSSFSDINNPDRSTSTWLGPKKVGNVSIHDYMKFEKGEDAELVYMSPDEYIRRCAEDIFRSTMEYTIGGVLEYGRDKINKYAQDMLNGDKFPIPYLNYANRGQEGRHRALAVKQAFGADSIMPVIVIRPTDPTEEEIREYAEQRWPNDPEWGTNYVKAKYDKFYEEPEIEEPEEIEDEEDFDNDEDFNIDNEIEDSDYELDDAFESELLDFINKTYNTNYTDLGQVDAVTFAKAVDKMT